MSSPRVRRRGIQRLYSAEDEVLDKIVQEDLTAARSDPLYHSFEVKHH